MTDADAMVVQKKPQRAGDEEVAAVAAVGVTTLVVGAALNVALLGGLVYIGYAWGKSSKRRRR